MGTFHSSQTNNCTLYPGEYIPLFDAEELKLELKKTKKARIADPFVNVSEQKYYFQLEAAIPGLQREDFFINIDNDIISISVMHKNLNVPEEQNFRLHEFNYDCFNRNVILPEHVETEFVIAEYKNGILKMFLPKTVSASRQPAARVIVY